MDLVLRTMQSGILLTIKLFFLFFYNIFYTSALLQGVLCIQDAHCRYLAS
jgi:hypothetical protein